MIIILLFLSGNFPSLSREDREQKLKNKIEAYGSEYKRLLTFYYQKEANVGLNVHKKKLRLKKKEKNDESICRNNKKLLVKRSECR